MPYTDDPEHIPSDKVRSLIGDISRTKPVLSDNEVASLLSEEGDQPLRAAARAAELLAARYSGQDDERRVGPLTLRSFTSTKVDKYLALAKRLWARVAASSGAPFAGGISKADKINRASDSDRVHPAFRRGMQRYGLGEATSSREERRGDW